MGVWLESFNFIVPIEIIEKKYRGGFAQCLRDHHGLLGTRVWFDDHLFRDGAMNRIDLQMIYDHWARQGFKVRAKRKGTYYWKDCCIIDTLKSSPALPCDWLEVDRNANVAYLKKGGLNMVVGPHNFKAHQY